MEKLSTISEIMLKKLLMGQSNHFMVQFIRYGFVAVVAFIIDFGLLIVFTKYLGIFYLLSSVMSFSISLVANYFLSVAWVFSHSDYKRSVEISAFIAIGLVGLVLNTFIIWLCTSVFGVYYLYSKLIAVAIVFFWSFAARRYFLFRGQQARSQETKV
jgi:putative flippase GtrA